MKFFLFEHRASTDKLQPLYLISRLPYAIVDGNVTTLSEKDAFDYSANRFSLPHYTPAYFEDLNEAKQALLRDFDETDGVYCVLVQKNWKKTPGFLFTGVKGNAIMGLILHPELSSQKNNTSFIRNPGFSVCSKDADFPDIPPTLKNQFFSIS